MPFQSQALQDEWVRGQGKVLAHTLARTATIWDAKEYTVAVDSLAEFAAILHSTAAALEKLAMPTDVLLTGMVMVHRL